MEFRTLEDEMEGSGNPEDKFPEGTCRNGPNRTDMGCTHKGVVCVHTKGGGGNLMIHLLGPRPPNLQGSVGGL